MLLDVRPLTAPTTHYTCQQYNMTYINMQGYWQPFISLFDTSDFNYHDTPPPPIYYSVHCLKSYTISTPSVETFKDG